MARQTLSAPSETSEQAPYSMMAGMDGTAKRSTLHNIGLIVEREYKNRVRQRSFLISTIVLLVLIVIAACVPTFLRFLTSSSPAHIAIVNNAGRIAGLSDTQLMRYTNTDLNGSSEQTGTDASGMSHFLVQMSQANALDSLRQSVKNGDVTILLVLTRASDQSLAFTYYTNVSASDDGHLSQIQAFAAQLSVLDKSARLGLTPQQTSSLFAQPAFTFVNTKQGATVSSAQQAADYFIAYAGVLLIFMSVFLYGAGVASGAAEEKSGRIMEVLMNAATPFQLMVGKVIGIGAAGLAQMVCLVGVGIGALLLQGPLQSALLHTAPTGGLPISVTGISIMLLLLVLVYFILGFLLYATLFAALGALVKRQDEVQNAVQPLSWLFMSGYLISVIGGGASVNALWIKVLSFVPFWTPTIMLMRVGAGSVSWPEIGLSVLIMIVAIFVSAVISARIYRFAVLMYGQKPGLVQLVRIVGMK